MFYTAWLPEHDEALMRHFSCGLSFAQISARLHAEFELKAPYSRNACIGRAHRLGLRQ
jgi:hypothetical protein